MKKTFLLLTVAVFLFTTGCSLSKPEETPLIAVPSEETAEPDPPASTPSEDSAEPPASGAPDEVGDLPMSEPSDETVDLQKPVMPEPTPETSTIDSPQDSAVFPYTALLYDASGKADVLPAILPEAVCPSWLWEEPHECIPLPLLRMNSQEELLQLCRSVDTNPYSVNPTLQETTAHCDRSFFESNSLIVIYIHSTSCSYRYKAQAVTKQNGALIFTVAPEDIPEGTILDWGEGNFLLTVTVPKAELTGNTQVYAHADTLTPNLI